MGEVGGGGEGGRWVEEEMGGGGGRRRQEEGTVNDRPTDRSQTSVKIYLAELP